jgi:Rrf2 family protein
MFALTKRTDYAIIALAHMAQRPEAVHNAREIAERYHMPAALLMNVLKDLCHGELVRSTRGVKGGYSLALPAEQITMIDIIRAADGPVRFVQCAHEEDTGPGCELLPTCPVSRPVRKVHDKLTDFLNTVTLAQIANDREYGETCVHVSFEGAAPRQGASTR